MLVSGEAGIGKTSLVRAFAQEASGSVRVLVGTCDDLVTPRTLGPFRDMAHDTDGPLAEAVDQVAGRDAVFGAVHQELAGRPTAMIVEDVHWPTTPPWTCSATWPGESRPCPACWCSPTATTSWATTIRCAGSSALSPPRRCGG